MGETSDIAFTSSVKAVQEARGSRKLNARRAWQAQLTEDLAAFLGAARSFYLATASLDGQPYIQHRGGPAGFLRVLGPTTLAFADFTGNRQFITTGNLAENPRAYIFVMDYAGRQRVKLWGRARVVADDPSLVARLFPEGYKARPEQAIVFEIEAWDVNCPQHIPQLFAAEDVAGTVQKLQARVQQLETEIAELKAHASR